MTERHRGTSLEREVETARFGASAGFMSIRTRARGLGPAADVSVVTDSARSPARKQFGNSESCKLPVGTNRFVIGVAGGFVTSL